MGSRLNFLSMEYPLTMIHDTPYICLELEQLKCICFSFGSVYACDFPWRLFCVCVCVCWGEGGCFSISNLRYHECGLAFGLCGWRQKEILLWDSQEF